MIKRAPLWALASDTDSKGLGGDRPVTTHSVPGDAHALPVDLADVLWRDFHHLATSSLSTLTLTLPLSRTLHSTLSPAVERIPALDAPYALDGSVYLLTWYLPRLHSCHDSVIRRSLFLGRTGDYEKINPGRNRCNR